MKLKLVDGIYCATCGYHMNFHPHATCEYVEAWPCYRCGQEGCYGGCLGR